MGQIQHRGQIQLSSEQENELGHTHSSKYLKPSTHLSHILTPLLPTPTPPHPHTCPACTLRTSIPSHPSCLCPPHLHTLTHVLPAPSVPPHPHTPPVCTLHTSTPSHMSCLHPPHLHTLTLILPTPQNPYPSQESLLCSHVIQYLGWPCGRKDSLVHEHVELKQPLPVVGVRVHGRDYRGGETGSLAGLVAEMSDLMSVKNIWRRSTKSTILN